MYKLAQESNNVKIETTIARPANNGLMSGGLLTRIQRNC